MVETKFGQKAEVKHIVLNTVGLQAVFEDVAQRKHILHDKIPMGRRKGQLTEQSWEQCDQQM